MITRHPALEKRITVACPMPRLAPVSSSVRFGALESCVLELGMVAGSRLRVCIVMDRAAFFPMLHPWMRDGIECDREGEMAGRAKTQTKEVRCAPCSSPLGAAQC